MIDAIEIINKCMTYFTSKMFLRQNINIYKNNIIQNFNTKYTKALHPSPQYTQFEETVWWPRE
jgi:hypothetical protein